MDMSYVHSVAVSYSSGTPSTQPRDTISLEDNVAKIGLEIVANIEIGTTTAGVVNTTYSPANGAAICLKELDLSVEGSNHKYTMSGEIAKYLSEMTEKNFATRADALPTATGTSATDYTAILYLPVQVPKQQEELFYTIQCETRANIYSTVGSVTINTVTFYFHFYYGSFEKQLYVYYFDQTINGTETVKGISKVAGNLVGIIIDGYSNNSETITGLNLRHQKVDLISTTRLQVLYEITKTATHGKIIVSSTNYKNTIMIDVMQYLKGGIAVDATTLLKVVTSSSTTLRFALIYEEAIVKGASTEEVITKAPIQNMQDIKTASNPSRNEAVKQRAVSREAF